MRKFIFGGSYAAFANDYSMTFDGVNEYITTSNFNVTGAISISIWMKTTTTNNLNAAISKDDTSSLRSYLCAWRGSTLRQFQFIIWNSNGALNQLLSTANILDDGQWHNILCTYSGTNNANGMKLYIDGVLDKQTTTSSTGVKSSVIPVIIGGNAAKAWYFDGKLDEIAIWDTDQSANAAAIYNAGTPQSLSTLTPLHWWRMGDGDTFSTNWTLVDRGSGGVNATSVNMESTDRTTDVP